MKTTIRNVEIKSVAAWLPANKISLLSFCGSFPEKQVRDVIRSSGAEYVYRAEEGQKASDLCFYAAEHLIERDNIDRVSSSTFPKNVVSNALVIVNITL